MADGDGLLIKVVPRIPAEYDDLYFPNKSLGAEADFSLDINSKMKVPTRLSVDGQHLHELEVENKRTTDANGVTSSMSIPHRITLSGNEREPLGDIYHDPYDLGNAKQYVAITTPPRVIAADTHSFPSINEEEEEKVVVETEELEVPAAKSTTPRKELSNPNAHISARRQPPTFDSLERRIRELEGRESSRQNRERLIVYPAIALYVLYKIIAMWRSL